ncbi:hypothetical protein ACEXQD_08710 [Herbiconiux sp. P15]|uniref:hypothetical protein n=1 Tax=Herbiconiux liukaitaii TaxID=3342799 RepID=UPI0035BAE0C0
MQDQDAFRSYHREGRRRVLRSLLVAAVVVGLAGGAAAGVSAYLAANPPRTQSAAAGSPAVPGTMDLAGFVSSVQADPGAPTSVHFTTTITASGVTITAQGDVSAAPDGSETALSMTTSLPDSPAMEARLVNGVLYVALGEAAPGRWAAFDMNDSAGPFASMMPALQESSDPTTLLNGVRGSIVAVETAGEAETLDGVTTIPYRVVVDTAGAYFQGMPAELVAELPAEIEYRMWVGPDGLLRKLSFDYAGSAQETTFERWGQQVTIEAPPAEEITQLTR